MSEMKRVTGTVFVPPYDGREPECRCRRIPPRELGMMSTSDCPIHGDAGSERGESEEDVDAFEMMWRDGYRRGHAAMEVEEFEIDRDWKEYGEPRAKRHRARLSGEPRGEAELSSVVDRLRHHMDERAVAFENVYLSGSSRVAYHPDSEAHEVRRLVYSLGDTLERTTGLGTPPVGEPSSAREHSADTRAVGAGAEGAGGGQLSEEPPREALDRLFDTAVAGKPVHVWEQAEEDREAIRTALNATAQRGGDDIGRAVNLLVANGYTVYEDRPGTRYRVLSSEPIGGEPPFALPVEVTSFAGDGEGEPSHVYSVVAADDRIIVTTWYKSWADYIARALNAREAP